MAYSLSPSSSVGEKGGDESEELPGIQLRGGSERNILLGKMGQETVRLYSRGTMLGYKRGISVQKPGQARIKIEGVESRPDTDYYLGKKLAYVYKAHRARKGVAGKESKYRVIWGKIIAPHGNNGVVKAKFRNNLPPSSIGQGVRVMMYPSKN